MAKARPPGGYIDLYACRVASCSATPKANEFLLARCRTLGVYRVGAVGIDGVYLDGELISVLHLASELPSFPTLHIDIAECKGAGLELGTYRGGCCACAPDGSRDVCGAFLD